MRSELDFKEMWYKLHMNKKKIVYSELYCPDHKQTYDVTIRMTTITALHTNTKYRNYKVKFMRVSCV